MKVGGLEKMIFSGAIIFLLLPLFVFAQESSFVLKENQSLGILDIIRKEPLSTAQFDLYYESIYYPESDNSAKAGAVVLVKQAILQEQLGYWFVKMPAELSKKFITAVYKLLPLVAYGDFSGAVDLIEKYTVEQANNYINNWLKQNQAQIGSGIGKYSFPSYKGSWQTINIPYIIVYSPIDATKAKIVIEFYSKTAIEPPQNKGGIGALGGNQDHVQSTVWPWDIWIASRYNKNSKTVNKIEPFIVRVKGQVIKDKYGNFTWDKSVEAPSVEVSFDELVPEIDQSDIILAGLEANQSQGFLKDKINEIKQKAEGIINQIKDFLAIFKPQAQISSFVGNTDLPTPEVGKLPDLGGRELESIAEQSGLIASQAEQIITEENTTFIEEDLLKIKAGLEQAIREKQAELDRLLALAPLEVEPLTEQATTTPSASSGQAICNQATNQEPDFDKVIFNEIAWMGTTKSSSDEWIELKNISVNPVDLNGWQIFNKSQGLKIFFTTTTIVEAGSFFLLERTNDDTVLNIKADRIYTGALANTDEMLYLVGLNCVLQDKIKAIPHWQEGDNLTKETMERNQFYGWQTSSVVGGTPKAKNSIGKSKPSGGGGGATNNQLLITNNQNTTTTATSTAAATTSQQATTTFQVLDIVFNEIAWMGTQASANHEWIELYNNTSQEVELIGWQIIGVGSSPVILSGKILPNSFYLLERTASTTISDIVEDQIYTGALSNSGEKMELKDPQGNVIDLVDCSVGGWFAGDNFASTSRKTMERKSPVVAGDGISNWADNDGITINGLDINNNLILGTPKIQNSVFATSSATSTNSTSTSTGSVQATSTQATTTQVEDLPAIITLMAIPSTVRGSVDLFWTCPTTSLGYIIKKSAQEISTSSWDIAETISQNIVPKTAGDVEVLNISNLPSDTKYYFAIQYIGLNGQSSLISDNVSVFAWQGFQDNNDGTLTDLRTGLAWLKNASSAENNFGTSSTQDNAVAFITGQNSDWRLPNFKELASLFNYSFPTSGVGSGFEGIKLEKYWSKSKRMINMFPMRYAAWPFDFSNGKVEGDTYTYENGENSALYPFMAVKNKGIPGGLAIDDFDFTDNADSTVKDNRTGLIWLNATLAQTINNRKNWNSAFLFANNAVLCNDGTLQSKEFAAGDCSGNGGVKYDDWRLPNIQELMEITKLENKGGIPQILPNLSGGVSYYWTSTMFDESNVWYVGDGICFGSVSYRLKIGEEFNTQLVRTP